MKLIACLLLLVCVVTSCGPQQADTTNQNQPETTLAAPDDELYTTAARNLVGQFSREIQLALTGAIDENGPAYALQVCQMRAQEIAAAHSAGGWSIKRVSEKWRNVADRPDSTELAILASFADKSTKPDFLTRWSGPDTAKVFHYYQKIVVREMCVQCHGDLQTVDLDLWQQVRLQYPYDKATGYKVGDLRGMFVVLAPYPAGEETARRLAEGVSILNLAPQDSARNDTPAGK